MKKKLSILFLIIIIAFAGYNFHQRLADRVLFIPWHQLRHQTLLHRIPEDLSFAGERIHFKSPVSYQRFYSSLQQIASPNESTRYLIMNARIWLPRIGAILKQKGVPEDFQYVAVAESNLSNVVSPMGAAGFWQFQAGPAREFGLEVNEEVDERYDPIKSTYAAAKFFKQAHALFGTWTSAAASFNSGMNGLQYYFRRQRVNSYYDLDLKNETASYMYRILCVKDLLKDPRKYGIKINNHNSECLQTIEVAESIGDLEKFALEHHSSLKELRMLNPWLMKNSLTIKKPRKVYVLLLPVKNIHKRL
ncbi:MAG: lytic transglycosylase domain-containing protein [Cytophagaceae bacterium]